MFFQMMFMIVPVLVAGIIIFGVFNGVKQYMENEASPILTAGALLIAKRVNVSDDSRMQGEQMVNSTSTTYYVTFQLENGERLEFRIRGREYGLLAEGDRGTLTYQGTRYQGFERIY